MLVFMGKYLKIPGYSKAKKNYTYKLKMTLFRHLDIMDAIPELMAHYGSNTENKKTN